MKQITKKELRQLYRHGAEHRTSAALEFLAALAVAALIGAPFAIYFWSMTP